MTAKVMSAERLLSTAEVAKRLHIHIQTARRYCRDGRIKAVNIGTEDGPGKRYRVSENEVNAFLNHTFT